MKRFGIARRLYFGFGIIISLTFLAFIFTQITIFNSDKVNSKIADEINPSVTLLSNLKLMITESQMYIYTWVYSSSVNGNVDAPKLKKLIFSEYPKLMSQIKRESTDWSSKDQAELKKLSNAIDTLFIYQKQIMSQLSTIEAYEDVSIYFLASMSIEANGEIGSQSGIVQSSINKLLNNQKQQAVDYRGKMKDAFEVLKNVVYIFGILLLLVGVFVSLYTVKSIISPVNYLKIILQKLGKGIISNEPIKISNDEIGDMGIAVQNLREGLERTTDFANEVGTGNFDSFYRPLSNEDMLGEALLKMRSELAENERLLEFKVYERTEEVVKQKEQIEIQSKQVEFLYEQVTDSIHYAKRIQDAILPPHFFINKVLPNSFIFFKPKDIVSGDFYFIEELNGKVYFAAVDCTGHGVPGAFMSIVGHGILKNALAILKNPKASQILDFLSKGVNDTMHQNEVNAMVRTRDGMDIGICVIDYKTMQLEYAGAFNRLYLVQSNELKQFDGNKYSIGSFVSSEAESYTTLTFQLNKGDCIYLSTDGYSDQFGGPKGRKLLSQRFKDYLQEIHHLPILEQRQQLISIHENWKGEEEQVDDILVIGVKI